MELKEYVIASVNTYMGKKLMLLTKEEYQLTLCETGVIRTTDDFDEAQKIYEWIKLEWDETYNTKPKN